MAMSGAFLPPAALLAAVDGTGPVPLAWVIPFGALLVAIAVLPLAAPHFWHKARNQGLVAFLCGAPVVAWALAARPEALAHAGLEYLSFVTLLGALFTISGGVLVTGDLPATPRVNTSILAVGVVLANIVGTTGAAMLLVRPLLRINAHRTKTTHSIVFFIFTVCNTGGLLTPLADPPLFLGFLQGVPFTWTLRLWPVWAGVNAVLLLVHHLLDRRAVRTETPEAIRPFRDVRAPLRLRGAWNLLLLAGVVSIVALEVATPWREIVFVSLAVASYLATSRTVHEGNAFSWGPILEVGILFAGLFAAMIPALEVLRARGPSLGVSTPFAFFWATGGLSGVLDNAPTYLAFLSVGQGLGLAPEVVGLPHDVLAAISLGAVLMGANSYLGNGPNFMVKAIAESRGVPMPSFGGYLRWSVAILVPLWVALSLVAF